MKTPYIGFASETLAQLPRVRVGDVCRCKCGHDHTLEPATDTHGVANDLLLFYRCGGASFLAAVDGRWTDGVRADVAGEL